MARYLPIADHGMIGDLHTVALVGTDGTIDWYCCPRFDSPSIFAAILDADQGGLFRICPACDGWSSRQLYLPETNILITRFLTPDGVGEVQDFMPPDTGVSAHRHRIIRRVVTVRGHMRFVVDVAPRFDYARAPHHAELTEHGALFRSVVPAVAGAHLVRTWAAIVNGTADWKPVIGEAPKHKGFYFNFFPWTGFTAGPISALTIAELVLGRRPSIDIARYSSLKEAA